MVDDGKKESKGTTASEIITAFASTTSGHGLGRIINSCSIVGRLFWLLVFLGACCWYGYLTINLITRFRKMPVQTEFKIISAGFLPFPAVTFCNKNVFRAGRINATDFISVTEFIEAWQNRNEQTSEGGQELDPADADNKTKNDNYMSVNDTHSSKSRMKRNQPIVGDMAESDANDLATKGREQRSAGARPIAPMASIEKYHPQQGSDVAGASHKKHWRVRRSPCTPYPAYNPGRVLSHRQKIKEICVCMDPAKKTRCYGRVHERSYSWSYICSRLIRRYPTHGYRPPPCSRVICAPIPSFSKTHRSLIESSCRHQNVQYKETCRVRFDGRIYTWKVLCSARGLWSRTATTRPTMPTRATITTTTSTTRQATTTSAVQTARLPTLPATTSRLPTTIVTTQGAKPAVTTKQPVPSPTKTKMAFTTSIRQPTRPKTTRSTARTSSRICPSVRIPYITRNESHIRNIKTACGQLNDQQKGSCVRVNGIYYTWETVCQRYTPVSTMRTTTIRSPTRQQARRSTPKQTTTRRSTTKSTTTKGTQTSSTTFNGPGAVLKTPSTAKASSVTQCPRITPSYLSRSMTSRMQLAIRCQVISTEQKRCLVRIDGRIKTWRTACQTSSIVPASPYQPCPSRRSYYMYLSSHRSQISSWCRRLSMDQQKRCGVTVDRRTRSWYSVCRSMQRPTGSGCRSSICSQRASPFSRTRGTIVRCPKDPSYYLRYTSHRGRVMRRCQQLDAIQKSRCSVRVDARITRWSTVCQRFRFQQKATTTRTPSRGRRPKTIKTGIKKPPIRSAFRPPMCRAYKPPKDCKKIKQLYCTGLRVLGRRCLGKRIREICKTCKNHLQQQKWKRKAEKIEAKIGVDVPVESLDDIVKNDDDYRAPTPAEFYFSFMKADYKDLKTFGHQLEDLVVECRLNGVKCQPRDFHRDISRTYGNCYTFNHGLPPDIENDSGNSTGYINFTNKAGPLSGLEIILDLEPNEYVMMDDPLGVLSIQHPTVLPLPENQGITLRAGQETHLVVKHKYISRARPPYSKCREPKPNSSRKTRADDEKDTGPHNNGDKHVYSSEQCEQECVDRSIEKRCRCTQELLSKLKESRTAAAAHDRKEGHAGRVCSRFSQEDDACIKSVRTDQILGDLGCNCPAPCYEHLYMVSDFSLSWPNVKTLRDLKSLLKRRNDNRLDDLSSASGNYSTREEPRKQVEEVRKRFAKVKIYYQELRYDTILENPAYPVENLVADLGGSLGLCIGFSVITIAEWFELAVSILRHVMFILAARANQWTARVQQTPLEEFAPDVFDPNGEEEDDTWDGVWDDGEYRVEKKERPEPDGGEHISVCHDRE